MIMSWWHIVAYREPPTRDDAPIAVTDNDSFDDLEDDFPIIGTCTAVYSFDGEFVELPLPQLVSPAASVYISIELQPYWGLFDFI